MNRELLEVAEKDKDAVVVLYHLPDNIVTPYVTWMANKETPENTYWGHYFQTLEDAQEDFDKRSWNQEKENRLTGLLWRMDPNLDELRERNEIRKSFRGYQE